MVYDLGVGGIQRLQGDVLKTQQQASTGRRILTPADDPIASASILELTQSMNVNDQNGTNATTAKNKLQMEESTLTDVMTLFQDVKTLAVQLGNDTLTQSDRMSVVTELQSRYQALMGLANTTDESGQYLFSGFKGATAPFSETSPGTVVYNGDQGQRKVRISALREVEVSDSGADIFQRIKTGNGVFVNTAGAANAGTGVVSPGSVLDISKWNSATNSKDFTIKFDVNNGVTPPVTTYDIVDNVSGNSLIDVAGVPAAAAGPYLRTYSDGAAISLKKQAPPDTAAAFDYGAELYVAGAPATGDTFTVKASTNQDIFKTLSDMINVMKNPAGGAMQSPVMHNGLNAVMNNLDNGLDNILRVRAAIGARLKEVESVQSTREDLSNQYEATISNLRDVDYAKTLSDLTLQQTHLQAAQQSFVKTQSLTLFNYLS